MVSPSFDAAFTPNCLAEEVDGVIRILESIKAGKRLPEAQFSNLSIAPKNQKSVYGMFKKANSKSDSEVSPKGAV